jgi:hypothetical protein
MPAFRKLSPEEIAGLARGRVDLSKYVEFLSALQPGEWGEVKLEPGEKKPTVKRRLTIAANRLGKKLRYRRTDPQTILFEVVG